MNFVVLPGAGMSGIAWRQVVDELQAVVIPIPDLPEVPDMAREVAVRIPELGIDGPFVALGASLGAMVGLELCREMPVAGAVWMAAGFGIEVSTKVLDMVAEGGEELLRVVARNGVAVQRPELVQARLQDLTSRGVAVMGRQLAALGRYSPTACTRVVPTVVMRGSLDRSVPPEDQAELAQRCQGALRTLEGVGHSPYLEAPEEVVRWARFVHAAADSR